MWKKDLAMSIRKVAGYRETSLRQPTKEVHKVSQKIKTLVQHDINKGRTEFNKLSTYEQMGKIAQAHYNSSHHIPAKSDDLSQYVLYRTIIEKIVNNKNKVK